MRSGSWSRTSGRMVMYYTAATKSWSITFSSVNGEQDTVTHGAIVKGDFVSPNPWNFSCSHLFHEQGQSYTRYSNGDIQVAQGGTQTGSLPAVPSIDTTNAVNEAISRAYGKIYGDLNLSVDVAEWHQTYRMLNASEQALTFMARRVPLLRKTGSVWLQYVYGWRPLAQSVWGAAYEMQNRLLDRVCTAVGRKTDTQAIRIIGGNDYTKVVTTGTAKARALVKVRYQEDGFPSISRWTSLNPLSIAWELTPYSFVVDWFYNIGGYMQDYERALLLSRAFRDGFTTISTTYDVRMETFSTGKVLAPVVSDNSYYCSRRTGVTSARTKLSAPPLPRPPVLNTHLGSGRLMNAAGLLSQFLGPKHLSVRDMLEMVDEYKRENARYTGRVKVNRFRLKQRLSR